MQTAWPMIMDIETKSNTEFKSIEETSKKEAEEEIKALRASISYHDNLYYIKNSPKISDAEYDKLFQRLEELEESFPDFKSDTSPTVRVGSQPVSKLKKVTHKAPLLSLQSTLKQDDIESFLKRSKQSYNKRNMKLLLEPKFDGLSVEIIYNHGHFEYGSTRGNGVTGEDISHNLKTIRTLPLSLHKENGIPELLAVRGEVFMSKSGFKTLNEQRINIGEEPFSNARNAAAGLIRQFDSREIAKKPLDIFFYEIIEINGNQPSSHKDVLESFGNWGLKTCNLIKTASSFKEINRFHQKLSKKRHDLEYEIDGIVIKIDDYSLRDELGSRERSPRWAIAWKFEPREEITTIDEIVIQVGRTGILTPIALLRPVDVSGVTVSRATLHNENEVRRKDIRTGDRVRIIRAGDVIPEVKGRLKRPGKKRSKSFHMPKHCPVCKAEVVRSDGNYICTAGLSCAAQLSRRIQHYADRDAMNINHLGEKTAVKLVKHGLVNDLADIYTLTEKDIESLEGFSSDSARQLHEEIHSTKKPRLDRFIYALGIPHVGRRVARDLAGEIITLDKLIEVDKQQLKNIPGIANEIAESIKLFFKDRGNREILARMNKKGVKVRPVKKQKKQILADKKFVFTGTMESYSRNEAKEIVESLGAHATSSVSHQTDFIVTGEKPGKKLDEAKDLNVKILNEHEFNSMLEKNEL